MMRFRRYSIELYRELGVFETVGSVRIASSPESLGELQRGVSRARAIGLDVELASPGRDAQPAAARQPGIALRLGLSAGRRQPRSAFGDLRPGQWRTRARRGDPHGGARDGHRARPPARGARRRHRGRAHRDGGGRQRGRHVGAPGGGHGRRPARLDTRRAPAHRPGRRHRARAAARRALLPRSRLSRVREVGGGRRAVRRLRARPRRALDRRRAVGPQRPDRAGRRGALRAAHAGRGAALPVPGRCGRGEARLPPRRDDAGRQSAGRRAARDPGLLRRGGPLAERIRRCGRHRQGGRRARHGR